MTMMGISSCGYWI